MVEVASHTVVKMSRCPFEPLHGRKRVLGAWIILPNRQIAKVTCGEVRQQRKSKFVGEVRDARIVTGSS